MRKEEIVGELESTYIQDLLKKEKELMDGASWMVDKSKLYQM